jgi:hypothetical protein
LTCEIANPTLADLKHERRVELGCASHFDPGKHLAWPMSPDEISRSNGAYKQTPGW